MGFRGIFFDIGWTLMKPRRSWFFSELFFARTAPVSDAQLNEAADAAMPILEHDHRMDSLQQEESQFLSFTGPFNGSFRPLPWMMNLLK